MNRVYINNSAIVECIIFSNCQMRLKNITEGWCSINEYIRQYLYVIYSIGRQYAYPLQTLNSEHSLIVIIWNMNTKYNNIHHAVRFCSCFFFIDFHAVGVFFFFFLVAVPTLIVAIINNNISSGVFTFKHRRRFVTFLSIKSHAANNIVAENGCRH